MISNYNKFFKEKQMRDILNLLDSILNESRGLSGRDPGAVYKRGDTIDDQITFQNLTFYPQVGQYATKEETEAAVAFLSNHKSSKTAPTERTTMSQVRAKMK